MRLLMICGATTWLACGALACGSANQPPPNDPVRAEASTSRPPSTRGSDVTARETTVEISKDIRTACGLPQVSTESPRFELDESTLRGPDKNLLDDVATCMKEGPLRDRNVTIVGRADPRGTDAHNQELGSNRAEATRNYLVAKGVPQSRFVIESRGEQGAQGINEQTFAADRRVDLVLSEAKNGAVAREELPVPPANPPQGNVNAASGTAGEKPPVPPANPPMKPNPVPPAPPASK